jgi:hypothetical protein
MRILYEEKKLRDEKLWKIQQANKILADYNSQGFTLTLRQLYYQFVSRDLIPNSDREYKKLGDAVADARLGGLMDWEMIIDRTRNLVDLPHWDDPAGVIQSALRSFNNDKWAEQPTRCEVWIEKDALVGVIEPICRQLDVPYFSCRGYASLSEKWEAGQRIGHHLEDGKQVKIIHLGDHDPSGIDMTRDIDKRLTQFMAQDYFNREGGDSGAAYPWVRERFEVIRIALTMEQIEEYNPPPNPAKMTDSRAEEYVALYGSESWELDALEPQVIADLIEAEVLTWRDEILWDDAVAEEDRQKDMLRAASTRWAEVETFLTEGK